MNRLDRYIAWQLVKDWTLVWIVMSAIFSLLAIVDELERIQNHYQTADVVQYILYTLPQRSMDLVPVIVLLGTILALARLNKNSEIIAMRAAGMPLTYFFRAVAVPALLLVLLLYGVSEYVSAPLYQKAETEKSLARTGRTNLLRGKGLWSVNNLHFFNVRTLRHGKIPSDIYLFQFAPDGRLLNFIYAETAEPSKDREWELRDVTQKTLEDSTLKTTFRKELATGPFWSPEELPVLPLPITGMTLTGLYGYVEYLHATNQNWQRAEQLFWQKIALPLTAGAMVLLATPIGASLRSQRSTAFGSNLAIGAGLGIGFYLLIQIINTGSSLVGIPPAIVAFTPTILVLAATGWLFSRMR
ncbi:lipopolysaccharide export system permease protein [Thiogranum longum]|uniref:Lipopolysaccharide export system permease protein n=1 Tax=Thiogranum longum TaxID=1537524 RepID=A0A4R1HEK7_9GAMM|nr:LPS export ABC transporter permease LptG [Thiogranum longum]TCK19083.1 lipopolysaccharide export system permease protein [Thiogranum longum]